MSGEIPSPIPVSDEPTSSSKKFGSLKNYLIYCLLISIGSYLAYWAYSTWQSDRIYRKATQLFEQGRYPDAWQLVVPFLDLPNPPSTFLQLGQKIARGLGDLENASRLLDRYRTLFGPDESYLFQVSLLRAAEGNLDQVRSFLQTQIQNPSLRIEALEALVRGCLVRYQFKEVEGYFDLWLQIQPDDPRCYFLMGRLYELIDFTKGSIEMYEKVLNLVPEHTHARIQLIEQLVGANRFEDAMMHCEWLQKQEHSSPTLQILYAECLVNFGQDEEAIPIVDSLLHTSPISGKALTLRGEIAIHNSDYSSAENWLREAIDRDPSNIKARYQYILCLKKLGKDQEAGQQNDRLLQLTNDLQRMRKILSKEIQERPNDAGLRYEVGMIAMRAGLAREGSRWLKTVLDLDPNHCGAHEALAGYYQAIGNAGLATRHLDLAQKTKTSKE